MKNVDKVVAALIELHKALGAWSTDIRNLYGKDDVEVTFQALTEANHRKLAGYFGLTPSWTLNHGGKTESLESRGVVNGVKIHIFAPSRAAKPAPLGDVKKTPALTKALDLADEAVRP